MRRMLLIAAGAVALLLPACGTSTPEANTQMSKADLNQVCILALDQDNPITGEVKTYVPETIVHRIEGYGLNAEFRKLAKQLDEADSPFQQRKAIDAMQALCSAEGWTLGGQ